VSDPLRILFIADVVGKPGRYILSQMTPRLKYKYKADIVVANTENAAGGFGITPEMARKVFSYGVDCQTSGNHVWDRQGIGDSGNGFFLFEESTPPVAVLSLMGRTYMKDIDCPFRTADKLIPELTRKTRIIIVDMHAEATSEKQAMGFHLDGRVSAVIGTHTHVQTCDEKILPGGTAYLTDCGMTGPHDAVLGMKKDGAISRFLTGMPVRLQVASDDVRISGVFLTVDPTSGKTLTIERFMLEVDLSLPLKDPEEDTVDVREED
jgi:calcineurin-like phosphoesterase